MDSEDCKLDFYSPRKKWLRVKDELHGHIANPFNLESLYSGIKQTSFVSWNTLFLMLSEKRPVWLKNEILSCPLRCSLYNAIKIQGSVKMVIKSWDFIA